MRHFLLIAAIAPLLACAAPGQQNAYICRPIQAVRASQPPKIDGDLSDPCWKSAAKAEVFYDQSTGAKVADQTVTYLAYDEKNVYVAFDCLDAQPDKIVARETVRDSKYQQASLTGNTEDNVEVRIDPFQTHSAQDLNYFSVNAIGTPSAQLAGGRANKAEWKGDFFTAAKRTPTGWTAEMQIPWVSLNYPPAKGPITIGINFVRYQQRTTITSIWSNIGPQSFLDKEGCWNGVTVPQKGFRPKVSLLPYALGAVEPKGGSVRFGMDARYTVTPELTAVGAFKPDFSTVEGAVQGIQFSRVERAIPEHRPFFLEGGNFFSVGTQFNDIGALFYSNRIDSFDLGGKLYGKISPADTIGLFDAYNFEGRNDTAFRFTHTLNPTSNIGAYFGRRDEPGFSNTVSVFDYHYRWGKLTLEGLEGATAGNGAGGGANVISSNYQDKNFITLFQYHDVSNNFFDADGYVPYTGYKGFVGFIDWHSPFRHGPLTRAEWAIFSNYWWDEGGIPYYRQVDASVNATTRSDWFLTAEVNESHFYSQTDRTITLQAIKGVSNRFSQFGFLVQNGILADHRAFYLAPAISLRVFKKLDLTYAGSILNLQGVTQQHILTANYELSPTRSFGGRIVTQDSATNAYLFYHNSGGRGTELYVLLGDPNALKFVKRLEVKVIFAI